MSGVRLQLQDTTAGGGNLLDALSLAAKDARSGGGIFAFASVSGVEMFLGDKYLRRLARKGGFELIVGVDAITNERALAALTDAAARLPKLSPWVLLHDTPNLMHSKLCWFDDGTTLTLVVGSGNLTPGGLLTHFEAFVSASLKGVERNAPRTEIDAFLARWRHRLLPPDDAEAIARAKKNTGSDRSLLKPMKPAPELPVGKVEVKPEAEVLVVEISKNVDERTQLDVGIDVFTGFFGARPEGGHILIQPVDSTGQLGEVEPPRAIFPTKSHNYRFEAQAGAGRKYPPGGKGRPFGVFVRIPSGVFRYRLIWPGEDGHGEVNALLTKMLGPPKGRMRRETVSIAELAAAWPDSPLLKAIKEA